MIQSQLLLQIIKDKGSVVPSKMCGNIYNGIMCGSDFPRRARDLRKKGILRSEQEGRFERYFLVDVPLKVWKVLDDKGNVERVIKLPINS